MRAPRLSVITHSGAPTRVALRAGADEIWLAPEGREPLLTKRDKETLLEARELGYPVYLYSLSLNERDALEAYKAGFSGVVAPREVLDLSGMNGRDWEPVPLETIDTIYKPGDLDVSVFKKKPPSSTGRIVLDLAGENIETIAIIVKTFKDWVTSGALSQDAIDRLRMLLGEPIFAGFVVEARGRSVTARLVRPLQKGDLVRISLEGTILREGVVHDIRETGKDGNHNLVFPPFYRVPEIPKGAEIYHVGSRKTREEAKEIISRSILVPVAVRLVSRTGKRAILYASDGEREQTALTEFEIERSKKKLNREKIVEELMKPHRCYEVRDVILKVDPDAALTIPMVRRLKREAIEKLSRERREIERLS